jgi:hypothetical protein
MRRTAPDPRLVGHAGRPFDAWEGLKQLDQFFQGKDPVHKSMRRLVKRLDKAGISYVLVGGMALFFHDYRRATNDVDLLLTEQGLAEFRQRFVPKNYAPTEGRPRHFVDKTSRVEIDILVAGGIPGRGHPTPIRYPDPSAVGELIDSISVVNLPTLVQLKLAARRHQDFADVEKLIRFNDLDESFAERLDPSVRRDYIECLEEKRRDDEHDARQG